MTQAVIPQKFREDLFGQRGTGSKLFEEFVSKRIKSNNINLCAPMKKYQLQTCASASKQVKLKTGDKTVELKED